MTIKQSILKPGQLKGVRRSPYGAFINAITESGHNLPSPAQIMDARNRAFESPNRDIWYTHFDTSTGIAATQEHIFIFPNAQILKSASTDTQYRRPGWRIPAKMPTPCTKIDVPPDHFSNPFTYGTKTPGNEVHRKIWMAFADNDEKRFDPAKDPLILQADTGATG